MGQRLVDRRVERLARLAEPLQTELADRRLECVGNRLEATLELAVLAGAADVVEHGQQVGEHVGQGQLPHRLPVALDAPPVVGVVGLQPLQVGGPLGELSPRDAPRPAAVAAPDVAPPAPAWPVGRRPRAGAAGSRTAPVSGSRRRSSRMIGPSVLLGLVVRSLLVVLVDDLGVDDIGVLGVTGVAGRGATLAAPSEPPAACASAYIAEPSFWLVVATFSVAVRMSATALSSVFSNAFFSSAIASSTSARVAAASPSANLSALSARNFSVW